MRKKKNNVKIKKIERKKEEGVIIEKKEEVGIEKEKKNESMRKKEIEIIEIIEIERSKKDWMKKMEKRIKNEKVIGVGRCGEKIFMDKIEWIVKNMEKEGMWLKFI